MNILSRLKRLRLGSIQSSMPYQKKVGWESPYETLRNRWVEVPTTRSGRKKTTELLKLSDDELLGEWQKSRDDITKGSEFSHRGWYHALYSSGMRGKRILDVGSGFGIDSLTFAQHGAQVTFLDIAESNLSVIRRLCDLLGLADVSFFLLRDVPSLCTLDDGYDFIMAMGSLHHAPVDVI